MKRARFRRPAPHLSVARLLLNCPVRLHGGASENPHWPRGDHTAFCTSCRALQFRTHPRHNPAALVTAGRAVRETGSSPLGGGGAWLGRQGRMTEGWEGIGPEHPASRFVYMRVRAPCVCLRWTKLGRGGRGTPRGERNGTLPMPDTEPLRAQITRIRPSGATNRHCGWRLLGGHVRKTNTYTREWHHMPCFLGIFKLTSALFSKPAASGREEVSSLCLYSYATNIVFFVLHDRQRKFVKANA